MDAVTSAHFNRLPPLVLPPHSKAPTAKDFHAWCMKEKELGRPLAVDLFAGAGGLSAGLEKAGWTVVTAVDHNEAALQTHRANFPGKALNLDLSNQEEVKALIEELSSLGIDLIAGGPPCQPFSRAGRAKIRSLVANGHRDSSDPRKELWRSFVAVIIGIHPRAVLMENVPDMAIGDDLRVVRELASTLEAYGYDVDYRLLDAWRYGVPQHRKRFILQARRDGAKITWPVPCTVDPTVRDAIYDLPRLGETLGARELPYHGRPSSTIASQLRNSNDTTVYDHITRPVRDDDREAFALMTHKSRYTDLPSHLQRYRTDTFTDKYKRLDWDSLSRTVTAHIAKDGYWYIHPEEDRTLSVREAARLQTFPDTFRFAGTRSDAFRQIGNAVPPFLAKAVATELHPHELGTESHLSAQQVRERLSHWARNERRKTWWFFPGPRMTASAAYLAAYLDVHRLPKQDARSLMEHIKGKKEISLLLLENLLEYAQTPSRKKRIVDLITLIENSENHQQNEIIRLLKPQQKNYFSLLSGYDTLLLDNHIREVVTTILKLPTDQNGLYSDIKVALARIVSDDKDAPLRMCALKHITLSELQRHILR